MPSDPRPAVPPQPDAASAARGSRSETTYWNVDDIQFHCRIGRTRAWRLVREPDFPAPVVLGATTLIWPRIEVVRFLEARRQVDRYPGRRAPAGSSCEPSTASYVRRHVAGRRNAG